MKKKHSKKKTLLLKESSDAIEKSLSLREHELFRSLKITAWSDPESRAKRVEKFGVNHKTVQKFHFFKEYLRALFQPFNILLIIIGVAEFFIWGFYHPEDQTPIERVLEMVSALIIFFMVILASVTDFAQDYLAFKNSAKMIKLISNDVFLVKKKFTSLDEITPEMLINDVTKISDLELTKGDLVYLKTGDLVPTEMKIIWSDNLYLDQSSLTGENEPVYKSTKSKEHGTMFNAPNLLISDTKIMQGKVLGLVLNIGEETYSNKIIQYSEEANKETDYETGLRKVTRIILILLLVSFPIIFMISWWRTSQWIGALIFAISMVVSLIPESLPAILSSNLQVGSKKMAKKKIVIKNFKAVQNLGATTTIATDKTGTLTTGKLELVSYLNDKFEPDLEVLTQGYSSVYFQNNLANHIDDSINEFWKQQKKRPALNHYKVLASEEFNFQTRATSILLSEGNKTLQITKGAPHEILSQIKISKKEHDVLTEKIKEWEHKSLKVILIATLSGKKKIMTKGLKFSGVLLFTNELKPGVQKIVQVLEEYKIDLKILTGDSEIISHQTGKDLQLINIHTIGGKEFSKMSGKAKLEAVKDYGIFAKLNPVEKGEIIETLKSDDQVVTYMGDGINDILALKSADVGISVNNGSATTKAASDVILLKKDLSILETGIFEGRKIFTNAIKFIKIVVAMNFGLLLTLVIGTLWFDFNAMSPIQLLLQNLFYDFMNLAFVFDHVDEEYVKKPQSWRPKTVLLFGFYNGLVPLIISLVNFAVLGYGFDMFNQISQATGDDRMNLIQQFQSAFFIESLTVHILLVLVYRTDQFALVKSRPSTILALVLFFFLGLGFVLIYTPVVNNIFGYQPMANNFWLLAYAGYYPLTFALGEFSKWSYKKLFHQWI